MPVHTILCVEDSDDSLFMLHRRLTRAGFQVRVATNGKEAVEWAQTMLPDVIVMDVNLPGLNGLEATRQLKSLAATKAIPIVMLTSHTSKKTEEAAIAAGCDAYETKPVDFPQLVRTIQSLLDRSAPGAEIHA